MFVDKSGKQMEFHEVVKTLLIEENDKSEEEAERLVKALALLMKNKEIEDGS